MLLYIDTNSRYYNVFCISMTRISNYTAIAVRRTNFGESMIQTHNCMLHLRYTASQHSRQTFVQTAKYCLPQITYLLIHVFFINVRQRNVKLVLLKELKPIILHFASENYLVLCTSAFNRHKQSVLQCILHFHDTHK
jgi:hypothetical protein